MTSRRRRTADSPVVRVERTTGRWLVLASMLGFVGFVPTLARGQPDDASVDSTRAESSLETPIDAGPVEPSGDNIEPGTLEVETSDAASTGHSANLDDRAQPTAETPGEPAAEATSSAASAEGLEPANESPAETESEQESRAPRTVADAAEATGDVVKTLLGLVALLGLAWAGGHERVRKLEERLGITQVVTSGLPFVVLGLLARAPGIDVLSSRVLVGITPILQFGLGWIGFHTGYQLDSRAAYVVPRGTATVVIILTALPFLLITALAGATLWGLGLAHDHVSLTRDAVMLGMAGALSAPKLDKLAQGSSARALELVRSMSLLDDAIVVVTFACLAAWLRPGGGDTGWILPAVGWVFVTFGMASVLGLVIRAILAGTNSGAERTSLLLGSVCLTAGMAATFSLPPLVVCFLAGVLLRNLPGGEKRDLEESFARLERPIYHLFLIIVGALWRPESIRGWLVLPFFLAARTFGRMAGVRVARSLPDDDRPASLAETADVDLVLPPMGQLAIAFVITAQTLYESPAVRAMVTAVIGGSVFIEVAVQVAARRRAFSPTPNERGRRPA